MHRYQSHMTFRIFCFLLFAAPIFAARGELPSPSVPTEVQDASSHLRVWLNGFRNKSETEVAAIIGKDYQKGTWQLLGRTELKINYTVAAKSTLLLLFDGDRVIKAEIYVMSEPSA